MRRLFDFWSCRGRAREVSNYFRARYGVVLDGRSVQVREPRTAAAPKE